MKLREDPRMKAARRSLIFSWTYFLVYVTSVLLVSYLWGLKPGLFGLPGWVAWGNLIIPVFFVGLLVFLVERVIPDVPLTDEGEEEEEP
jgi:uncharacterized membrane protein YhdT